jgi:lysophospholipase L1-like esterase
MIMKINFSSRLVLTIIGFIFIFMTLVVNQFTWLAFVAPDGVLTTSQKVSFFMFDIMSVLLGMVFLFKRHNRKELCFTLILIGIMFFSVEAALRAGDYLISTNNRTEVNDKRQLLSPYRGENWAIDYFNELSEVPRGYEQFLGWRRGQYEGEYININSSGVRKTWNPPLMSVGTNGHKTIYMFGGSTVWGTGARDDYTIPLQLAKVLHKNGHNIEIINYGESGYIFFQEIINLIILLRDGLRPDYVIFYDGVNDVYGAYQSGVAGKINNFERISHKLATPYPSTTVMLKKITKKILSFQWSKIHECIVTIHKSIVPSPKFTEIASSYTELQLEELADDIVGDYQSSVDLLKNLSLIYNFEYLVLWQPVIYTEEYILDEELTAAVRAGDKSAKKLYQSVDRMLREEDMLNFYNLSDVLKGRKETFYIDYCHLSEKGNQVVGEKIYSIIEKDFMQNE